MSQQEQIEIISTEEVEKILDKSIEAEIDSHLREGKSLTGIVKIFLEKGKNIGKKEGEHAGYLKGVHAGMSQGIQQGFQQAQALVQKNSPQDGKYPGFYL